MPEKLNFKITLGSTYWENIPEVQIVLNDEVIDTRTVSEDVFIEFQRSLADEQSHVLDIRLLNKTQKDTVVEDGKIVNDMLLHIKDVLIDDVYVSKSLRQVTEYILDVPYVDDQGNKTEKLYSCFDLGWNGIWRLNFQTPFFIWLLETM